MTKRLLFITALLALVLAVSTDHPALTNGNPGPGQSIGKNGVRKLTAIPFAVTEQVELKLDLHLPPPGGNPVPLLVWIHGGGWTEGGRGFCPIAPLAAEGYGVASISYRFAQEAVFPAQIEDARAAIRWLRAHGSEYNLDTTRIGVCGESAGAHLAALLGTHPDETTRVQCVVDLCGPTDFTAIDSDTSRVPGLLFSFDSDKLLGAVQIMSRGYIMHRFLGGSDPAKARAASPITYVSKDSAPFYIIHGAGDYLVPLAQSQAFRDALQKAGVEAELEIVPNHGHGFGRLKPDMLARIKTFLDRHLR